MTNLSPKIPEDKIVHKCYGVQPHFTCHYNGACYGEICIDPAKCSKRVEELTDLEKVEIFDLNRRVKEEMGI